MVYSYISNDKDLFNDLHDRKDEIEEELGIDLEWNRFNNKKDSRIVSHIDGLNFVDHRNYFELMNNTIDLVIKTRDVLSKYINNRKKQR